jgi:protein-tyrosine phosphatase
MKGGETLGGGFVDIHTHILPGLDDGAGTMEESLEFCRIAVKDGVALTVATPHVRPDRWPNTPEEIRKALASLRDAMEAEGLEHRLEYGAEVHLQPELGRLAREGAVPTYADKGRHLLLELPNVFPEYAAEEAVESLRAAGITPIIAHPERCETLVNRPDLMYRLVRSGALGQVTGLSLEGTFGARAKQAARLFLRCNLVHFVASDAHSTRRRRPVLRRAYGLARSLVGEEAARMMVVDNPNILLAGGEVPAAQPQDPEERRGFLSRLFGG